MAIFPKIILCTLVVGNSYFLYAEPFIQKEKQFEIDWGNLRLRFVGSSFGQDNNTLDYQLAETSAFSNGLLAIKKPISDFVTAYYQTLNASLPSAKDPGFTAGQQVESSTFATKSEYFSDGSVQITLESQLTNAFYRHDLPFSQTEPQESSSASGIIFKCQEKITPQAIYELIDKQGKKLYTIEDVSAAAFKKNLMGRFFHKAQPLELRKFTGTTPITVNIKAGSANNFVVDSPELVRANVALLKAGRVVFDLTF